MHIIYTMWKKELSLAQKTNLAPVYDQSPCPLIIQGNHDDYGALDVSMSG